MTGEAGRRRRIFAGWPEDPPPPGGWPVLYLLDGNVSFPIALAAARMQGRRTERTGVLPALLIAIGHPGEEPFDAAGRMRDYTPPAAAQPPGTGGAEAFLDFIGQELMPEIHRRWPVDTSRQAIFGHSLGGLLVLHAFLTRPGLFRRSVAASPSIWWQDRVVLAGLQRFAGLPREEAARLGLMMIVGGEEEPREGAELDPARLARLRQARMIGNARDLAGRLAPLGPEVRFLELPEENHGSVLPAALSRALRFALAPALEGG